MNIHQMSVKYFETPKFDEDLVKGVAHMEMKYAMEEIEAAAKDLNRLGIQDFEFVKCSLTDPLKAVQRSIFPFRSRDGKQPKRALKLDRDLTYMINLHFRYKGKDLDLGYTRIPLVEPGSKFVMWGKNYFIRNILVDRGVNLSKNELFIRLERTSFSMARTTHPFKSNGLLSCDNVLTGNPHRGRDNKKGKDPERIGATQNLFLYLLARYGWTKTLEHLGADLTIIEGENYDDVYREYYPKGYTVLGSSEIKTSDGGRKSEWNPPRQFLLYKGDLEIGTTEYNIISLTAANFYYIADRIPDYLSLDVLDDIDFWTNILGRFIFFRVGKGGQWYTDSGRNHLVKSIDTLIDARTQRQLLADEIDVNDTYDLFKWLMINEKEVYANVHPSDISRKRITALRYVLSYAIDNINKLGYRLLGSTDEEGKFKNTTNHRNLNDSIRTFIKEGTIRALTHKEHGEVQTLESTSSNMFITNTRALLDQTRVRSKAKDHNHMYNRENILHESKFTRCRVDGIDAIPSGATQINAMAFNLKKTTALVLQPWLQDVEDKLGRDLRGDM